MSVVNYIDPKIFKSVTPNVSNILEKVNNESIFEYLRDCILLTQKWPILYAYIEEFLSYYPELIIQINDKPILHYACQYSKYVTKKTIALLIRLTGNINQQCNLGYTPLHYVVKYTNQTSSINMIKILVKKKANINALENNDLTPLHLSLYNCRNTSNIDTVYTLINLGADVNLQDNYGWSALHYVSRYSGLNNLDSLIEVLVDNGANINLKENNGWTSLQLAVRNCQTESSTFVVHTLIKLGAIINTETTNNISTFELAFYEKNNIEIIQLLYNKLINNNNNDDNHKLVSLNFPENIDPTHLKLLCEFLALDKKRFFLEKKDECIICYDDNKVITCSYNHGICFNCFIKAEKFRCFLCSNKLNFFIN